MTDERLRIERLAGLCRAWGAAKFFHPYLAYNDIDWDAALVSAIPKVSAASSTEEYAKAVTDLLSTLGDPATRVLDSATLEKWTEEFTSDPFEGERRLWWRDDVAVMEAVQLTGLAMGAELTEVVDCWLTEMEKAVGLIFDLRRAEDYYVALRIAGVAPRLLTGEALQPAIRTRMHSGYTTDGDGSGGYSSGFYVTDALPLSGRGGPLASKPLVLILDERIGAPGWTVALQAAGRARIVFAGDPDKVASSEIVQLPEDLGVLMRTSEHISPDGTVGFTPDAVVSPERHGGTRCWLTASRGWRPPVTRPNTHSPSPPSSLRRGTRTASCRAPRSSAGWGPPPPPSRSARWRDARS